jgi:hypothetical protein
LGRVPPEQWSSLSWLFRQEFDEPHASDDAEHDFAGFYSNILAG